MTFGALIYVYLNNVGLLAFKKWFDVDILGFSRIGQLFFNLSGNTGGRS